MGLPDPALPPLVTRGQARAAGLTDRQIDRRLASGRWRAVRRGVLLTRPDAGTGPLEAGLVLGSALMAVPRDVVVGYEHAARLWGLPSPLGGWGDPVLLAQTGPPRNRDGIRIRIDSLPTDEVVELGPALRITSVVRTVLDCARVLPAADALAIADAALRRLIGPEDLVTALNRFEGWPAGRTAGGRRGSSARRTGGRSTRSQLLNAAGRMPPGWLLAAERAREARIRRIGADIIRWGAGDVLRPSRAAALSTHITHLLTHRRPTPLLGTARPAPVTFPRATVQRPREPPPRWLRGR